MRPPTQSRKLPFQPGEGLTETVIWVRRREDAADPWQGLAERNTEHHRVDDPDGGRAGVGSNAVEHDAFAFVA